MVLALAAGEALARGEALAAGEALAGMEVPATPPPGDTGELCWIFFAPRPPAGPAEVPALGRRACERLRRAGRALGDEDRPVHAPWVRAVAALGIEPRERSRWLHAISARLTPAQRAAALALPFVERIAGVPRLRMGRIESAGARAAVDRHESAGAAAAGAHPAATTSALGPGTGPDSLYGDSFHQLALLGIPDLHARGLSGRGILIVSLDSGFHCAHPVFDSLALIAQRDFVHGDSLVQNDDEGDRHGTLTASVLAGWSPGHVVGAAPGAMLGLARTEEVAWERLVEIDHFVAGLEWADSLGADIVTASLGYLDFPDEEPPFVFPADSLDGGSTWISRTVNRMAARGLLVVVSAGNSGPGAGTLLLPADSDSGLAVGAVYPWGEVTWSSSRGPVWNWDGVRYKPDLCAQGAEVACASWQMATGSIFTRAGGTSLATPLAAGLAALVLEARPELRGRPLELIAALHAAGNHATRPDHDRGYGLPWGPLAADPAAGTVVVDSIRWVYPPRPGWWTACELRLTNRGGATTPEGTAGVTAAIAGATSGLERLPVPVLQPGEQVWVGPWEMIFTTAVEEGGRSWVPVQVDLVLDGATFLRSLWAEVRVSSPRFAVQPVEIVGLYPQPWRQGSPLELEYSHSGSSRGFVELVDVQGRLVARLASGIALRSGGGYLSLDPPEPRLLPSGRYALVLRSDRGTAYRIVTYVR